MLQADGCVLESRLENDRSGIRQVSARTFYLVLRESAFAPDGAPADRPRQRLAGRPWSLVGVSDAAAGEVGAL
jgi:hypothetical protein